MRKYHFCEFSVMNSEKKTFVVASDHGQSRRTYLAD